MNSGKTIAPFETSDEIPELIQILLETERRLEALTGGEVDTVAGRDGQTFLLRRAQDHLRLREAAKQAAILNALPAHVALIDSLGFILSVNETWRRFARTNALQGPGYAVGLNYLEICDRAQGENSAEAKQVAKGVRAVLDGTEKSFSIEYPCHAPQEMRWFLLTVNPLAEDARNGAVVMHVNITERKRSEAALQSSEARYRTMLQGIEAGVIVHGPDLAIVAFNPKAAELLGVDHTQLTRRVASDIQWGRLRADGSLFPDTELPYRRAFATRQPVRDVVVGVNRQSTLDFVWLLVNAHPVLTPQGEVAEVIVTLMDVTSRIQAERSVQRQQTELRVLFDLMPALIWFKDTENRILRVNQRVAEAAGKQVHEIEGKPTVEIYPREAAKYFADDLEVIHSGVPKLGIVEMLRDPDGREIWVQTDKVPVGDTDGKVVGIVVVARDITERKRAEEALRASEEHLQLAARAGGFGTFEHDLRTGGVYWSPLVRTMLGLSGTEEFSFEALVERIFPPDRPRFVAAAMHARDAANDGRLDTEYRLMLSDHSLRWLHVQSQTWFEGEGTQRHAVRVVGVVMDSTERKRTEQMLRESEKHFRFLNDLTEATRTLVDPEKIMVVTSRLLGEHLRVSRCAYADVEKDGEHFTIHYDYTHGCASTVGQYELSLFGARAVAKLHGGQTLIVRNVTAELLPEEGADMFTAIGIAAIISCPLIKEGGLRAIMAVHQTSPRDWTPSEVDLVQEVVGRCWATIERRTAEENLRMSEKRFKALFEQAAVGVALTDAQTGRFVLVNERFCQIAGRTREDLEELTSAALTHSQDIPNDVEKMRQLKAGSIRESTWEKRYVRSDQSEVWVNLTVSAMWAPGEPPDLCIAVVQEITERKVLEEQLRQTQKMEAIGTLAGGIAHDFNNILTAINGYTELARLTLKENPDVREYLGAVLQASTRATDLVRQILAFSRQERMERLPLQLRPVIVETLKLLRATLPATIEFETSLASDAPVVLADATQIHQVLMNLGTNASHAMKDRPGKLQVRLERCVVDAMHAATQARLRVGVYARLSVADTGCGMDAVTRGRIFEPFFTTKAPGVGTGLGLSVVHGIMANHDGVVTVYSELGEGTVFDLYFPAHAGEAILVAEGGESVPEGRGERILFVDDEELLAQLGRKTLAALGYEVEVTTQPAIALQMVRDDPLRFALVLTDQTMPGMTGLTLAAELLKVRPGLPIILMTGYSLALTVARVEALGISQLLLKPTTLKSLGTAIHAALSVTRKL